MNLKLTKKILSAEADPRVSSRDIGDCYNEILDELLEWFEKADRGESSGLYSALQNRVDALRDDLRESAQALTRAEMLNIITRLRAGDPIGEDDQRLIRLWLIGDAEAYVKEENNFGDWIAEVNRLAGEIQRLRGGPVTPALIKELQAVLTDARGVIPSIANYLIDRERVQQFEETMSKGLEDSGRRTLASVLEASYESQDR